jgi:hypothetical protein
LFSYSSQVRAVFFTVLVMGGFMAGMRDGGNSGSALCVREHGWLQYGTAGKRLCIAKPDSLFSLCGLGAERKL